MSVAPDPLSELCADFKLPTLSQELVPRMTEAEHREALSTLSEILEMETEDRRLRRIVPLPRAAKLPAGKSWENFDLTRLPVKVDRAGFSRDSPSVPAYRTGPSEAEEP